jgi:hypothetical protein
VATTRRAGPSADDRRRGAPDIAVWLSKPRGFAALQQRRELHSSVSSDGTPAIRN